MKSRRRREAAGKVTRQRRHELVLITTQRNGVESSTQRDDENRSPWGSQVAQTSHYFPIPTSQPQRPAEASAPTRSISGFIAPIPNITSSVPEVPTVPQQDPFPLLDQPLDEPMLNDLPPHPPQLLPQAHHLPPHQTPSYQQHSHQPPFHQPQLRRPTPTPETVEADARSAMWHEHGETMKQIKDNVDSLLATLWARDVDPRELRGMFESLREEVGRTRERLLQ
ncbi:hypothetical protein NCC49_002929 [Naganishia albida]|nr:hypothetical protein NCC49_002929 [Naganishia albida]